MFDGCAVVGRSAAWLAVGVSGALLGFVTLVVVVRVVSDVNTIATTQAAKIHLPEVNSSHVEEAKSWAVLGMESVRPLLCVVLALHGLSGG